MNVIDPSNCPPDELDEMLRGYFQAEMPHPWPQAACGVAQPRLRPERCQASTWWNSRLALAASIALLLLGSLLLSRTFQVTPRSGGTNSGSETAKPVVPLPRTPPK